MFNMEWNSYLVSVKSVILLQLSNISVKTSKESQYFVGTELGWFEVFFLQSYHSMPSYTWFEPILTPLWSSYLVWTILTNKLILVFVLRDGLKFFWTIISFFTHVYWMNEALTTRIQLLIWVHCLPKKVSVSRKSSNQKTVPTVIRPRSVDYIAVKP